MADKKLEAAKQRVRKMRGFYIHALIYVVVNAGLVFINLVTSPDTLWFYWPMFGWGIGLFFHWLGVFAPFSFLGSEWEEKKIKEIMKK